MVESRSISFLLYILLLLLFPSFCLSNDGCNNILERDINCPLVLNKVSKNCENINCEKLISEEKCPPDTIYRHNFSLCGCCPACVRYLKLGDEGCTDDQDEIEITLDPTCDPEDNHCPILINKCSCGLVCNINSTCELPALKPEKQCLYRKSLYREGLVHWDPRCEPDGDFAPKQCKGTYYSGECFCVTPSGERLFGREWWIQAENQTCACSRKVSDLRKEKLISTYHCTPDGNYEPLQCDSDSGLCYCVDTQTGKLRGPVVPQAQWKLLPCYSLNITNGSLDGMYLRQCESEYAAIKALEIENEYHGTKLEMKILNCDYDGSYSPVMTTGTRSECVYKNGTRIGTYISLNNGNMNCHCARDVNEYFPSHERPRTWGCDLESGNYRKVYDFGSYASCVDMEGFLYGDQPKLSKYFCCLMKEGCSTEIQEECWDEVSGLGIKPCDFWPYDI